MASREMNWFVPGFFFRRGERGMVVLEERYRRLELGELGELGKRWMHVSCWGVDVILLGVR